MWLYQSYSHILITRCFTAEDIESYTKLQKERYKNELAKQIEEKRQLEMERKRKEEEEEKRIERKAKEEEEKLRKEYEKEQAERAYRAAQVSLIF